MLMKDGQTAANSKQVRVAIAQSVPVYLDKHTSLAKALDLIGQAAKRGAHLIAFAETWLSGYPAWLDVCPGAALWENASAKDVFARLRVNSILVPGEEVSALCKAARDLKIAIVIGASERVDAGPGNDHSTTHFSLFPRMDNSGTRIGSSSRPTRRFKSSRPCVGSLTALL
jgi:predicted amidohydrolase